MRIINTGQKFLIALLALAVVMEGTLAADSMNSLGYTQAEIEQQSCLTVQAGVEFFFRNMAMTVKQYMERFNHIPVVQRRQTVQHYKTHFNTDFGGAHFKFEDIPDHHVSASGLHGKVKVEGNKMIYNHTYWIESEEKLTAKQQKLGIDIDVQMTLEVVYEQAQRKGKEVTVPQLRTSVSSDFADGLKKKYKCSSKDLKGDAKKTCDVVMALEASFIDTVFSIENGSYFDQVSAARLHHGLRSFVNGQIRENAKSILLEMTPTGLNLAMNCPDYQVAQLRRQSMAPDFFEVGLSENVLDYFLPYRTNMNLYEAMAKSTITAGHIEKIKGIVKEQGMETVENVQIRLLNDDEVSEQIDFSQMQKPGFTKIPEEEYDQMMLKKLDRMQYRHNLYLELVDSSQPGFDRTILPIEVQYDFLWGMTQGIGSMFGPSQQFSTKFMDLRIEGKTCQFFKNSKASATSASSDDEFEDDEETSKFKVSPAIKLGCSLISMGNSYFLENKELIKGVFRDKLLDLSSQSKHNTWYSVRELEYSFHLLCSGIQLRHPVVRTSESRFFIGAQVNSWFLPLDEYCDNNAQELDKIHPRLMESRDHEVRDLSERLGNMVAAGSTYSWIDEFFQPHWYGVGCNHMAMIILSPFLHQMVAHYPFRKLCRAKHPELDEFSCAHIYSQFKPHNDYDRIMDFDRTYFDYSDSARQKEPLFTLREIAKRILYVGMFFHFMGIRINKTLLIATVFIVNSLMLGSSLLMPFRRYGPDTTAYMNQAAQFFMGQTDYTKISSMQGFCYYPAGHLWHYAAMYLIYIKTDLGEFALKAAHVLLHSGILAIVCALAYKYFKRSPMKAQLICFLLLGNEEARELNQLCFNDSILAFYLFLCVYLVSKNSAYLASLAFTLSLSIKAGSLLLLPALLGWIQYHHGTFKLAVSIFIVVFTQIFLAAPFIFDPVAKLMGFDIGAQTSIGTYLSLSKLMGTSGDRKYGAIYDYTLYWRFVGQSFYESSNFILFLQLSALGINALYFFFGQKCFMKCIDNLFEFVASPFNAKKDTLTFSKMQKAIEILVILFLTGVNFVPGGHQQFQLWYLELIPLATMMTGLPSLLTYKAYHDIFPCRITDPNIHHYYSIGLAFFLLIIGPRVGGLWSKEVKVKKD